MTITTQMILGLLLAILSAASLQAAGTGLPRPAHSQARGKVVPSGRR